MTHYRMIINLNLSCDLWDYFSLNDVAITHCYIIIQLGLSTKYYTYLNLIYNIIF